LFENGSIADEQNGNVDYEGGFALHQLQNASQINSHQFHHQNLIAHTSSGNHFSTEDEEITSREQVTKRIVIEKVRRGIRWQDVAEQLGMTKV
jgi:frataxin-like iron-binding protein CyaY